MGPKEEGQFMKETKKIGIFAFTVLCAVALVGCGLEVKQSGFLKDYSQLKPGDRVDGTMIYENPAKPLKAYNKFMVDPVVVHFAPDAKGGGIDPDTLNDLATYFHSEVTKLLSENGYSVVKAPDQAFSTSALPSPRSTRRCRSRTFTRA